MDHQNIKTAIDFFSAFSIEPLDSSSFLLSTSSQQKLMVRTHFIHPDDNGTFEEVLALMDTHLSFDHRYITPLIHFQKCREGVRAFYHMDQRSLKQDIQNRSQIQWYFEEKELWELLSSVVDSLIYLQNKGSLYGILSSSKIFIDEPFRLMDPSAFNLAPMNVSRMSIHSPEIADSSPEIDFHQSDVYLLGLCLLEAASLTFIDSKSTQQNLKDLIKCAEERYSQDIVHVLGHLLKQDPQERPSFQDIKQYIESEIKIQDRKMRPAELLAPDFQDASPDIERQVLPEEDETIDRLQLWSKKEMHQQPTQYQQARDKFLDSPVSKPAKTLPSTIDTSKQRKRSTSIQSKRHKKTQENKQIQEFDLKLAETVNKKPKISRALQIKNRNSEQMKKIQLHQFQKKQDEPFTNPIVMSILKQETERAKEYFKASHYR